MMKLKRIFITISAILISLISLGRAFYAPDIGSAIIGVVVFALFMVISVFYLFENKIRTTKFFQRIDSKYLSKSVSIFGRNCDFSLILYYAIGSYFLLTIFFFTILTGTIPYEHNSIGRYLFYLFFTLLAFGAIYCTRIIVRVHKNEI